MGFLRRHRSLFFPKSHESNSGGAVPPAPPTAFNASALASLEAPRSPREATAPREAKLRRRKSFFEVIGFGKKKNSASKRQSLSAASVKPAQRPRSATVGDAQRQESDIPPVPPLPPLHKIGNVAAVQLDDLGLGDDHMAALTAVVNDSGRDEPPEHLFLSIPGSNNAGSRLSVADKRASTISTRSTASTSPPQSQAQQPPSASNSVADGQRSRRSSLRNSLLVAKNLPDLPSGRPVTPTRARAAPPSSYAPPPESIGQRLQAASVSPEATSPAQSTMASTSSTPPKASPAPVDASASTALRGVGEVVPSAAPEPLAAAAVEPTPEGKKEEVEENLNHKKTPEQIDVKPAVLAEPSAPSADEKKSPVEAIPALVPDEPQTATLHHPVDKSGADGHLEDAHAAPLPVPDAQQSLAQPSSASALEDEVSELPYIAEPQASPEGGSAEVTQPSHSAAPASTEPDAPLTTKKAVEQPMISQPPTAVFVTPPPSSLSHEQTTKSEEEPTAVHVTTSDDEVPDQTWSSSSHPSSPSILPRTPVGDEFKVAIASDSPPLTPQRTGSPVAVKQRNVSAPLTREPDSIAVVKGPRAMGSTHEKQRIEDKGEKAYATPAASPIGRGQPPVAGRNTLRAVSLPPPRRGSVPQTPPKDDPSLDDFVGLMKQVISREKGMSIRDAAKAAEQRKESVPA